MANSKISALTSATTPLAGTETLPIVQSSTTKQVSIANLTAGRSVSAADYVMSTGNLVPSTAAKGVNFSANTPAAGMTSQLLNWYEEGTWTPTITPSTGSFTTVTLGTCRYTRFGRVVTVNARFTLTNSGTGAGAMTIAGLPFTISSTYDQNTITGRVVNSGIPIFGQLVGSGTSIDSFQTIAGTTAITNGYIYTLTATYTV